MGTLFFKLLWVLLKNYLKHSKNEYKENLLSSQMSPEWGILESILSYRRYRLKVVTGRQFAIR